jgi:hypothetical protein
MRWIQDPLLPKCSQIYQNCPIFPKKRLTNPEIAEENPGLFGIVGYCLGLFRNCKIFWADRVKRIGWFGG